MDWFLYDRDLHCERMNHLKGTVAVFQRLRGIYDNITQNIGTGTIV